MTDTNNPLANSQMPEIGGTYVVLPRAVPLPDVLDHPARFVGTVKYLARSYFNDGSGNVWSDYRGPTTAVLESDEVGGLITVAIADAHFIPIEVSP